MACPGLVTSDLTRSSNQTAPRLRLNEAQLDMSDQVMAMGMPPEEAGEMIVKGIEREDFIIPLHAHVVKIAETRWQDIANSFAAHAPYTPDTEKYNVQAIVRHLLLEKD